MSSPLAEAFLLVTLNNCYETPSKYIFYTCFRYIGYNDKLAGVYIDLPLTNKLIWNFTVKK